MINRYINLLLCNIKKAVKAEAVRNSIIYLGARLIERSIPFLMLPLMTALLAPKEIGLFSMFQIVTGFLLYIVGFNLFGSVAVKYCTLSKNDFGIYLGNCFLIFFLCFLLSFVLIICFYPLIYKFIDIDFKWQIVALLHSFFQVFISVKQSITQQQKKPYHFGLFQISYAVFSFGSAFLLIKFVKSSWEEWVLGLLICNFIFGIISVYSIITNAAYRFRISFNKTYFMTAINFGSPLILHAVLSIVNIMVGRFWIKNLISLEETAYYSIGLQISNILYVLLGVTTLAYNPWLFEKLASATFAVKQRIVKLTYIYFVIVLIGTLVFSFIISPLIFKYLIHGNYYQATKYVFWQSLSFAFTGLNMILTGYITFSHKTKNILFSSLIIVPVNVGLSYILIAKYGGVGANISSLVVSVLSFVSIWYLANKSFQMPWFRLGRKNLILS